MRLFYFTQSFPFGIGQQWKTNELNILKEHFEEIVVIPFTYAGNYSEPKQLPDGVHSVSPLFDVEKIKILDLFRIIFHRKNRSFINEFFKKKVYNSLINFKHWVHSSIRVINLLKNSTIQKVIKNGSKNDILYFYWGRGSCEILPFINAEIFHKCFVRMHRYDLFEYVNNGYIPYRDLLLKSSTVIASSSQAGKEHLDKLYPDFTSKIKVIRCGTISNEKISFQSSDGIFRIISCALLTPVKRVDLEIASLKYIDFPIEWYHVGDGYLKSDLENLASELGVSEKFHFLGLLDSNEVLDYYTSNPFDLFVNVSESEGVPFSIMEAFSVGIPVLATDVGGTGEIVNEKCGRLINKDISPQDLAIYITNFYHLNTQEKDEMKKHIINEYETKWNAKSLTRKLALELKN